jgi:hypothetical protein
MKEMENFKIFNAQQAKLINNYKNAEQNYLKPFHRIFQFELVFKTCPVPLLFP